MTSFLDAHVHPPVPAFLDGPLAPYLDGLRADLGLSLEPMTGDEFADFYRARDAKALLLGWDAEAATNRRSFSSADVAALVASAPDVFFGFGSTDPTKGAAAVGAVHETARLGLSGLSLHPAAQGTGPGDRTTYPVWEAASQHHLIVLFHTGLTRVGAGLPGGGGIRLAPARPIHVDAVAARFPNLRIIISHTGLLWRYEALAVALHKRNVHLCLAGQSPKTLGPDLMEAITGPLRDRVHFGSDFPFGSPDAWITEWEALGMPEDLTRAVLHDNAHRLLHAQR